MVGALEDRPVMALSFHRRRGTCGRSFVTVILPFVAELLFFFFPFFSCCCPLVRHLQMEWAQGGTQVFRFPVVVSMYIELGAARSYVGFVFAFFCVVLFCHLYVHVPCTCFSLAPPSFDGLGLGQHRLVLFSLFCYCS